MNVRVVLADRLTADQTHHWSHMQACDPELRSPFFHPAYTCEAAKCFAGVEVAILEEAGEPLGYFPFQRAAHNRGLPVGRSLNDFQGVIARPGFDFDVEELVRACRLSGLRFTQMIASQRPFSDYHWCGADSPSMDLSDGFDAYARRRREAGSTFIMRFRYRTRTAVRDLGPLRFETGVDDPRVFDRMIAWKARHFERIGARNPLARNGTPDFFKRLLTLRDDDFRGVLSALYFGDRLAAVGLGIRCRGVLHSLVSTYDEKLGKYSPGSIFFIEQGRAAEEAGIRRIDLGAGNEAFKASFRSFGTRVAQGAVGLDPLTNTAHRSWLFAKNWLESSRFRRPARSMFRAIRGFLVYGLWHGTHSRTS